MKNYLDKPLQPGDIYYDDDWHLVVIEQHPDGWWQVFILEENLYNVYEEGDLKHFFTLHQ